MYVRSTPFLPVADLQRTPCISKNMQISRASLLFLQPVPSFSSSRCSLKFNLFFTGCPIILPRENENVLLGAAILGAVAAKQFGGVHVAIKAQNESENLNYFSFGVLCANLLVIGCSRFRCLAWFSRNLYS